jgi:hypothetical protein
MILPAIIFVLFILLYCLGIAACVYQENELSLPHEKAVRMTTLVIIISLALFLLALYAFINIDWELLSISTISKFFKP